LEGGRHWVTGSRTGEGPVDGVWPSDHLAVVADPAGPADGGADGTGPG
jgi:hypothetical protein